ncbi:MAG: thioesterase family protein [Deltaproteobacteria bacterium]|nr:thioesterase family protein [Deltaproteobacteria bacterium]
MSERHPGTDDLSLATALTRTADDSFLWNVPSGWEQGRGVFGGLVVAATTRAAMHAEPDGDRIVRAISCEILAPVSAGLATVSAESLRRGNGVSAYEVRVIQKDPTGHDEVRARATITLAKDRPNDRDHQSVEAPTLPAFDTLERAPLGPPIAPTFTQHLDFRPVGSLPFSGATVPSAEGYVHAPGASSWGPPEWLALVDSYWPTLMVLETGPRPLVTLTFHAQLLDTPAPGPFSYRGRALATQHGFSSELRELFDARGRLIVSNVQTIAVVK